MIRILLLLLAVLWIAPAQAQTPTRLCFPTGLQTGTRTSCQDVTATNPLPVTGINISVGSLTLSAANAVTATLANSTAGIGLVTIANTATVPAIVSLVNTTVNIGNTAVVTCTNCGASSFTTQPSLVTLANTATVPGIVSLVNTTLQIGNTVATTCTNCLAPGDTSLVTIANTLANPAIVSCTNCGSLTLGSTASLTVNNIIGVASSGGARVVTGLNLLTTINKIKDSAGQLFKVYCYNPNSSVAYIQIFNLTPTSVSQWLATGLNTQGGQPNSYAIPGTTAAGFVMNPVPEQYSAAMSAIATLTSTGVLPPTTGLDCQFSIN